MEPLIECRDLLHRLGDDELVVVDCRDPEAWEAQPFNIPGALRMTLAELCEAAHILPDDELIVLCGIHSDNSDSRRAYRVLRVRNRDAVCLNGGLEAWQRAGFPTEPLSRAADDPQDERADQAG
jgi:rhodanese-related sulfurtransferase